MSYVLPFENRGVEMGVTLHHPHGQIYGYGFLPRQQQHTLLALQEHHRASGTDLITQLARAELGYRLRIVAERAHAMAFTPAFARFPYETWIVPTRHTPYLWDMNDAECKDMAAVLSDVLRRQDALWNKPMPYLLTINQAPTDGEEHPEWSLRIEIWPIRRAANKLKFLAGTELGAGVFVNDITPEKAAELLRKAHV
jgi:UDPglucose--hexose-1-phosphate uridylyltransferase